MKIVAFLAFVAATTGTPAQEPPQDLSRYAGRDLRELTTNEVAVLQTEFKARTGAELGQKWGWCPLAPWLLAHYDADRVSWLLVEAYPGYDIPDVSGMKLHFFNESWAPTSSRSLPTGYRYFLNEVTVQQREQLDRPLIVAKATCAGPFITSPGPKRPAFEQGDFQFQYYALMQTNVFMVRLEDNHGVVARNHFRWSTPTTGPPISTRSKEEWIKWLGSTNVVQQLSALVWLTGEHLPSSEERKSDQNQESVADSKLFESVRDDPRTTQVMNRLKGEKNRWVQDYALLGILK